MAAAATIGLSSRPNTGYSTPAATGTLREDDPVTDQYVLGETVPLRFLVVDDDGQPANAGGATLAIYREGVLLGGTPALPTSPADPGDYRVDYLPGATGRYQAIATFTGANADVAVDTFDVVDKALALVVLADVQAYVGSTSWGSVELQRALDAERAAQAKVCNVDVYGPDLREALLRRVARNLAARAVPLAQSSSFDGGQAVTVPYNDPEIRRLEGPYRKRVIG